MADDEKKVAIGFSFDKCQNITDVLAKIAELQNHSGHLLTSDGIVKRSANDLAAALLDGHIEERANEYVEEYFVELDAEITREQTRETKDSERKKDLRLPTDGGRVWRR